MAKESMKAREVKRAKLCAKYADKRKALIKAGDFEGLQKLPKNSSPVRAHNRCKLTARPKGYMRQFGISRVLFREMANKGLIPGVHAIHIHEKADCSSDDGKSSGGHWNPTFENHGSWGSENGYHRGDIGNFNTNNNGEAFVSFTTDLWCLVFLGKVAPE